MRGDNMKTCELIPIFSNRKSFYNKAYVNVPKEGIKELISYNTLVAKVYKTSEKVEAHLFIDELSNATASHLKEFLKQEGFKATSKVQMVNDYYIGDERY